MNPAATVMGTSALLLLACATATPESMDNTRAADADYPAEAYQIPGADPADDPVLVTPNAPVVGLELANESSWTIARLHLAGDTCQERWGADILTGDPLAPGDTLGFDGPPCRRWNLRLFDAGGDECIIWRLDPVMRSNRLRLTDELLAPCLGPGTHVVLDDGDLTADQ